jgi:Family of unknown function (DUF5677)
MPNEPHKGLLDRDLYAVLIREHFSETTDLLEELVNYGSNLIPRCFHSSNKGLHDIVIILNFLKQAVALVDSIHILASKGATVACFICLRSLFEISTYLQWIFLKDTEKRGSLYFVWDLRRQLRWALSVKPGTPEHEAHKQHMRDTRTGATLQGLDQQLVDAQITLLQAKLSTPECASINQEFDRIKEGLTDKEWYTPAGVRNLREMAKGVKKEGEYKVYYSSFSAVTHGLAFDKHVSFSEGKVMFEPIRNLKELDVIFRNTLNFVLDIYRSMLTHYRPGEVENFNRKYLAEWRPRFLSVKKIEYKNGTYTIKNHKLASDAKETT